MSTADAFVPRPIGAVYVNANNIHHGLHLVPRSKPAVSQNLHWLCVQLHFQQSCRGYSGGNLIGRKTPAQDP